MKPNRKTHNQDRNLKQANADSMIKVNEYVVSYDAVANPKYPTPHELKQKLATLAKTINQNPKEVVIELESLLPRYPKVPELYNDLSAAYGLLGEQAKMEQTIVDCCQKFPDYLFAKINYAQLRLHQGHFEEIPSILGPQLDLKALYPTRKIFHVTEITGFMGVLCAYYCCLGHRDSAKQLYDGILELAPDSPVRAFAENYLYPNLRQRIVSRLKRILKA